MSYQAPPPWGSQLPEDLRKAGFEPRRRKRRPGRPPERPSLVLIIMTVIVLAMMAVGWLALLAGVFGGH